MRVHQEKATAKGKAEYVKREQASAHGPLSASRFMVPKELVLLTSEPTLNISQSRGKNQ